MIRNVALKKCIGVLIKMNVNKYLITKYNQHILIISVSLSVACMRMYCYFFISLDATDNQVNSGVCV